MAKSRAPAAINFPEKFQENKKNHINLNPKHRVNHSPKHESEAESVCFRTGRDTVKSPATLAKFGQKEGNYFHVLHTPLSFQGGLAGETIEKSRERNKNFKLLRREGFFALLVRVVEGVGRGFHKGWKLLPNNCTVTMIVRTVWHGPRRNGYCSGKTPNH